VAAAFRALLGSPLAHCLQSTGIPVRLANRRLVGALDHKVPGVKQENVGSQSLAIRHTLQCAVLRQSTRRRLEPSTSPSASNLIISFSIFRPARSKQSGYLRYLLSPDHLPVGSRSFWRGGRSSHSESERRPPYHGHKSIMFSSVRTAPPENAIVRAGSAPRRFPSPHCAPVLAATVAWDFAQA
jgi:hypothetical protein